MSNTQLLKRRSSKTTNGLTNTKLTNETKKKLDPDFAVRESVLTILLRNSLHIRTIYHIFVAILLLLLFDTAIFDFLDRGKINVGVTVVVNGFGDIKRGAKLWLYEFSVALLFYPCLNLYSWLYGKFFNTNRVTLWIWSSIGIIGVIFLQTALVAVPVWDLSKKHLEIASSVTVTIEMFRFVMKVHAVAVACAPRVHNSSLLPSFSHYVYFLFAPTLVYRDQYPRTKQIRWGFVLLHFLEVAAIIFYNGFLWERFMLPYWSDYGKQPQVDAGTVVRSMFACILPGAIAYLCGFYCLLHAWLNAFAEMMKFGDRLFYEDWWTTTSFSHFYRAWNRVVHSWLRYYIYQPMRPRAGRVLSTLAVFVISAIAHELILALSFGFFYPVLLIEFGVLGLILLPLSANTGRRFPNANNLFIWLALLFGNGTLWSLYPMEYFARLNCPPSENDSYFIPKSWSCPEITLKPNWKFKNPLDLLYS